MCVHDIVDTRNMFFFFSLSKLITALKLYHGTEDRQDVSRTKLIPPS